MKNTYPIEVLLRPPLEWYSATAFLTGGLLIALFPAHFLLFPTIAYALSGSLWLLSTKRFIEGYRVVRYQKNLTRLPYYALSSRQLPISQQKLFLGRGFRWQPIHTQRLFDCRERSAERYVKPSRWYLLARQLETRFESNRYLKCSVKLFSYPSRLNPVRPLPPVGGNPILHGVEPNEVDVWMPLSERVGHTLVLGTTRVGKTRLLEVLATHPAQITYSVKNKCEGIIKTLISWEAPINGE